MKIVVREKSHVTQSEPRSTNFQHQPLRCKYLVNKICQTEFSPDLNRKEVKQNINEIGRSEIGVELYRKKGKVSEPCNLCI